MIIVTLTVNPAVDKSAEIDQLVPEQKLKCEAIQYQAGVGGVNISRVLHTLNVNNECLFTAGGDTGAFLVRMLREESLSVLPIPVENWTRENLAIY